MVLHQKVPLRSSHPPSCGWKEGVSGLYLFHIHDMELALPLGQGCLACGPQPPDF